MSDLEVGTFVHITNQYDRLFFDEVGTITDIQQDYDATNSYYVDVPRLAHGRWFQRDEFEAVGEQQEEKDEGKPDSLVTIGDEPGVVSWNLTSGVPCSNITIHFEIDGAKIAQRVISRNILARTPCISPPFQLSSITPPPLHHDGRLDNRYDAYLTKEGVGISDSCDDHVDLSPKAALSLLAWLRQQENELQQLAQEDKA